MREVQELFLDCGDKAGGMTTQIETFLKIGKFKLSNLFFGK